MDTRLRLRARVIPRVAVEAYYFPDDIPRPAWFIHNLRKTKIHHDDEMTARRPAAAGVAGLAQRWGPGLSSELGSVSVAAPETDITTHIACVR